MLLNLPRYETHRLLDGDPDTFTAAQVQAKVDEAVKAQKADLDKALKSVEDLQKQVQGFQDKDKTDQEKLLARAEKAEGEVAQLKAKYTELETQHTTLVTERDNEAKASWKTISEPMSKTEEGKQILKTVFEAGEEPDVVRRNLAQYAKLEAAGFFKPAQGRKSPGERGSQHREGEGPDNRSTTEKWAEMYKSQQSE